LYELNQRHDRHVLTHDELVAAGRTVCRNSFQLISPKRVEQVTSRRIVVEESDIRSVLNALKTAAALCHEHSASLHDLAASILGGWVHDGFKAGELGACAADRMGDTLHAMAEDYLRLVALIEDGPIEDVPGIVFDCVESA